MADSEGRQKLLFVAPSAYTVGGLAAWLEYLAPGLERRGWQVTVALASGRFHDAAAYLAERPLPRVVEVANPSGSREGRIRELTHVISGLGPSIVVSVNMPDSMAAVARLRYQGKLDLASVMTIHGIQPNLFEDCWASAPFLAGVICTNRLASALVKEEAAIDESRVYYAPGGVEIPKDGAVPSEVGGRLRVAYVGRFERFHKRVLDIPPILEALEHSGTPFEFMLAGEGPEEDRLRAELSRTVSDESVTFLGSLRSDEVFERVYKSADVLLLTSLSETGPLVVWEAMARRVCVVSAAYIGSGLEGALRHDLNCLLFEVGDAPFAARQLERASDPELRRRLTEEAFNLVRSRYSLAASIGAWDSAFRAILERPPLRAVPPPKVPGSGRLDHLLGPRRAETLRRLVGRSLLHREPGGEWPHSYGSRPLDDKTFWERARELDRPKWT